MTDNSRDRIEVTLNAYEPYDNGNDNGLVFVPKVDVHYMPTPENMAAGLDCYTYWSPRSQRDGGIKFAYYPNQDTEVKGQRRIVHYPGNTIAKYEVFATNSCSSPEHNGG